MPGSPTARSPTSRARPGATRSTCCSISGLEENLDTGLIGRFFNAVDDGVEPLVKHKAGVIALSDAGAHLVYLCDAGLRALFPRPLGARARRVRPPGRRAPADQPSGRALRHPRSRPHRGRRHADLLLFDPATVGISAPRRVNDLPGGGPRTTARPDRRARRVRQWRPGVRRQGLRAARARARAKCSTAFCRPARRPLASAAQ